MENSSWESTTKHRKNKELSSQKARRQAQLFIFTFLFSGVILGLL